MNKIIINIASAILLLLTMSSCEDFLTQDNPNELPKTKFWTNLYDCEVGLVAVYNQLRNTGIIQLDAATNRSDLSWPGYGRPNTSNEYYLHTFTDGSGAPNGQWQNLYKGIFRANQVIEGLNGISDQMEKDEDKEQWTRLMGEARFFRGLFYFWLHSAFNKGSVPIFDYVPELEEEFYQKLRPEEEVRAFFIEDLTFAYNNLEWTYTEFSDAGEPTSPKIAGRITKGSAAGILGKSYLYQKQYDDAAFYLKEIIESNKYQLAKPNENSTTVGEFNQESLIEIAYDYSYKQEENQWSPLGTTNAYATTVSPVGGWRGIIPSCWLIREFQNEEVDGNDHRNQVDEPIYDVNTGVEIGRRKIRSHSLRASYSILLADDDDNDYYGEKAYSKAPLNNLETAYFRKLSNYDILSNENDQTQRSGINYRVLRLADVYLMYAECLIKGGEDESGAKEAVKYLNKVRHRSALKLYGMAADGEFPDLGSTYYNKTLPADTVMHKIMFVERPLELCLEGFMDRQIDLRRWGITKQRFIDLSQNQYHGENFEYYNFEEKKKSIKYGAILADGIAGDPNKTLVDYQQAAANYIQDLHGWWPIPNSETTANPNL
ncbi:RagB/SusD family nutrient uptake outer membrane protein [Saccharicrinis aurantiacus]|uniref:RagB/SusD family nutrient uptake outer membrane protein n=1 Tax=Saccharicrinis aurantiacus TaxID=1849719 RepID=UPI0008380BD0|nr:RagB/SusD family nutrient uptake outer membrane protein [Saccharicrinis aurantiacus]